ncbi:unnamed protein product [marine sediment metagenome]|uniref:Uncharacterized protein n=1 Tax=marine sediment metagenome TaxID=412755 RepID=X1QYN0_9ZZZZ
MKVSRFHIWVISLSVKHVYGPKKINAGNEDVIATCHVKNGEEYVDAFIEHYNQLGVKHIVFLDNNSQGNDPNMKS